MLPDYHLINWAFQLLWACHGNKHSFNNIAITRIFSSTFINFDHYIYHLYGIIFNNIIQFLELQANMAAPSKLCMRKFLKQKTLDYNENNWHKNLVNTVADITWITRSLVYVPETKLIPWLCMMTIQECVVFICRKRMVIVTITFSKSDGWRVYITNWSRTNIFMYLTRWWRTSQCVSIEVNCFETWLGHVPLW
jgi:hypothetical protein